MRDAPLVWRGKVRKRAGHKHAWTPPGTRLPTSLEIELLSDLASPVMLARAFHCAKVQGVAPLDALFACTNVNVEDVVERLTEKLDVALLDPASVPRGFLPGAEIEGAFRSGVLRLPDGRLVIAARGRSILRLAELLNASPDVRARIIVAAPRDYVSAVLHAAGPAIGRRAENGPQYLDRPFSARSVRLAKTSAWGLVLCATIAFIAALEAPLA